MSSGGRNPAAIDDQDRQPDSDAKTVRRGSSLTPEPDFDSKTPPPSAEPISDDEIADGQTVIRRRDGSGSEPGRTASPAEIASILQGGQLGHFVLQELIGGGGMGAVFRGLDTRLDRTVAVKVIPNVGDDPDLQRRFRNEAQSAARLDHPNIARVYDVGRQGKWHYIVFEYIEGVNLRDQVAASGPLSIDDAVYYTHQVAEALHHASRRGVVHRDIKPSNVLVTREGTTKLVDMGLARTRQVDVTDDQTASGVTLGTFDYISPEQARDPRNADVRSDLYSLGCSLFYMLTGRPPYPGGTMLQKLLHHGGTPPPDPRMFREDISESLTLIIHKLLEKHPDDRYQNPLELMADLQELAEREDLSRAEGLGTVMIAPAPAWIRFAEHVIPWAVALLVLFISVVWLKTAGRDTVEIPPRTVSQGGTSGPPAPASEADLPAGASSTPSLAEVTQSISPGDLPDVLEPASTAPDRNGPPAADALPEMDPASTANKVIVSSDPDLESTGSAQVVDTLAAAFAAAELNENIDLIQLADEIIESKPVKVPRDGLSIEGAPEGTIIQFVNVNRLSMERPRMFDASGTQVTLKNVHLFWSVPNDVYDGGCLIELRGNESFELVDSSITIENRSLNEVPRVYAFEYRAEPAAEEEQDTPSIGVNLRNVIARGQMTFINLQQVAGVDLIWKNGLLATSGSLLETVGAVDSPPVGYNRIELQLEKITAFTGGGLVNVRLGPSGAEPILLRRRSEESLFAAPESQALITFSGLPDLATASDCLLLTGIDNAYHAVGESEFILYEARTSAGEIRDWTLEGLQQDEAAIWFREDSVEPNIGWTGAIPPDRPFHLQTPADYAPQDLIGPGFNLEDLPTIPTPKPLSSI